MSSLIEVGFVIDSLVTLLKYSNLRRAEKSRPWTLSMVKTVCAMLLVPFLPNYQDDLCSSRNRLKLCRHMEKICNASYFLGM